MTVSRHLATAVLAMAIVSTLALAACGGATSTPVSPAPSASAPSPSASAASAKPSAASPSASAAPTVDSAWAAIVEAGKKEGKVTLYGQFGAEASEILRKSFNAQYPQITLDFVTGSGSQTFARLQTEQRSGKMVGDVVHAGATSSRQMKKEGLYEPFEPPILKDPAVKWVDPKMAGMDPQHMYTPFSFLPTVVLVNTDLVKSGEEPKSYKEMADPKWKGKIMAFSPKLSGNGSLWYTMIGKGNIPAAYAGPDYLQKMKDQDIRWVNNYDDGANLVARGEASIFFPAFPSSAARLREAKAPTKSLQMSEGSIGSPIGKALVKNAPHPNAAKVFLNWLGTEEGQKALAQTGDVPLRAGIPATMPELDLTGVKFLWFETDAQDEATYPLLQEAGDFFGIK